MAETILKNVLNATISIDDLFTWLTSKNVEDKIFTDIIQNECTRTEFLSYFLHYLREQSKSVLEEKLVKKTLDDPQKRAIPNSGENLAGNGESAPECRVNAIQGGPNKPIVSSRDSQSSVSGQPFFHLDDSPLDANISGPPSGYGKMRWQSSNCRSNTSPRVVGNVGSNVIPEYCSPSSSHEPNSTWPLATDATSVPNDHSIGAEIFGNSNMTNNREFPLSNNFGNVAKFLTNASTPNASPNSSRDGFNGSISQAEIQMANVNLSESFGNCEPNVFSNVSGEMGSPQTFNNSMKNMWSSTNAPSSPVSPLYRKNVLPSYSKSLDKSQNESGHSQDYPATSVNSSTTSTPKGPIGSGQKPVVKSGQNHNRCLADFMMVSKGSQSAKKSSKKHSRKSQPKDSCSPANEERSAETGGKSKRRINPTRLDVSCGGDNPGEEIFGVITRPIASNPKFVEAPSSDKSDVGSSFEIERQLLKLERRKKPNSQTNSETMKIEKKLSIKTETSSWTAVPCVDLVENMEVLDTLANIYSGILHRNLMTNPMTELYFLVTLLTTQYKTHSDNKQCTKTRVKMNNSPSSVKLLQSLKDDLGCAEIDDQQIYDEILTSRDNDTTNNKSTDENTKTGVSKKNNDTPYLGTPHNCVYFATVVMMKQTFLLTSLDRTTLKLLIENNQINGFQPQLKNHLSEIYRIKCAQSKTIKPVDFKNLQANVCFQVDTDNRETFPTFTTFALFRKQRDLFYDILREWEENHLKPKWSFEQALTKKIVFLLDVHNDAVNYCHLGKLFVSQLLVSSTQGGQSEDGINDETLNFLMSLKNMNPEKMLQLKERLVTPLISTGPVPEPLFPGVQEFFKKFILAINDWRFYVILETSFIHETIKLNETQFAGIEIEGTETTMNESTRQNYITCLSSLRLLAKFVSFMMSRPFNTSASSPGWVSSQIKLREQVVPSLDLRGCLTDAIVNRRLSLTVPWIVEYMSMLDTAALRLPYYVNIGQQLYRIYRISNNFYPDNGLSSKTAILMMFTIGWLFELPNFPRDLHNMWQINYDEKKIWVVDRTNDERDNGHNIESVDAKCSKEHFVKHNSSLDKLDIIDDRAIYECCPFLSELKILLISGNVAIGNNNPNRHITPVSCQLSQSSFLVKTKNLQMELEEAFFNGQPSSIRKTVDFVSERVASSCVKYICNRIIPATKQKKINDFIKWNDTDFIMTIKYEEKLQGSMEKLSSTNEVDHRIAPLATAIMEATKKECDDKISKMCGDRTIKSIESLLSDDAYPTVKEICASIARRMAMQRIDEWIEQQITESLFSNNLIPALKRLLKLGDADERTKKQNIHNPEAPCPTKTIEMIRNSMWELMENKGRWEKLSVDSVTKTLMCLRQTLTERADLVGYPEKTLYVMSVEFSLLLLAKRQNLFTPGIQDQFINIWKIDKQNRVGEAEGLFVRIISPRNIQLLTDNSKENGLRSFSSLLKRLLKEDLLSIECLGNQCVALFRQEWPETTLKQLSQCINQVVADYKSSSVHAEAVRNLLVWIASMCDEIDVFD